MGRLLPGARGGAGDSANGGRGSANGAVIDRFAPGGLESGRFMDQQPPRKPGRLRQMRVVPIRPRGTPKEAPPELPKREPGDVRTPSAFPDQPVPFADLGLPEGILRSLEAMGYTQATAVQAAAIPRARAGRDLIVQSRTGTGKTAAFGIPIIEKSRPDRKDVQALILCPTRELCLQVTGEMGRLGAGRGV